MRPAASRRLIGSGVARSSGDDAEQRVAEWEPTAGCRRPRFRYTIVNDFLKEGVDASFVSDEELIVDAIVPLGDRRYVIERIHDQGGTEMGL